MSRRDRRCAGRFSESDGTTNVCLLAAGHPGGHRWGRGASSAPRGNRVAAGKVRAALDALPRRGVVTFSDDERALDLRAHVSSLIKKTSAVDPFGELLGRAVGRRYQRARKAALDLLDYFGDDFAKAPEFRKLPAPPRPSFVQKGDRRGTESIREERARWSAYVRHLVNEEFRWATPRGRPRDEAIGTLRRELKEKVSARTARRVISALKKR